MATPTFARHYNSCQENKTKEKLCFNSLIGEDLDQGEVGDQEEDVELGQREKLSDMFYKVYK